MSTRRGSEATAHGARGGSTAARPGPRRHDRAHHPGALALSLLCIRGSRFHVRFTQCDIMQNSLVTMGPPIRYTEFAIVSLDPLILGLVISLSSKGSLHRCLKCSLEVWLVGVSVCSTITPPPPLERLCMWIWSAWFRRHGRPA